MQPNKQLTVGQTVAFGGTPVGRFPTGTLSPGYLPRMGRIEGMYTNVWWRPWKKLMDYHRPKPWRPVPWPVGFQLVGALPRVKGKFSTGLQPTRPAPLGHTPVSSGGG